MFNPVSEVLKRKRNWDGERDIRRETDRQRREAERDARGVKEAIEREAWMLRQEAEAIVNARKAEALRKASEAASWGEASHEQLMLLLLDKLEGIEASVHSVRSDLSSLQSEVSSVQSAVSSLEREVSLQHCDCSCS